MPAGTTVTGHASTATGACSMWAWGHSREKGLGATDDDAGQDDDCGVDARIVDRGDRWMRTAKRSEAHACSCQCHCWIARMTRGKQKIEAQKRSAERNEKPKGSQIEARNAGLKTVCSVCKAPLANYKQLVDHFGSKHPKETVPPGPSS